MVLGHAASTLEEITEVTMTLAEGVVRRISLVCPETMSPAPMAIMTSAARSPDELKTSRGTGKP